MLTITLLGTAATMPLPDRALTTAVPSSRARMQTAAHRPPPAARGST